MAVLVWFGLVRDCSLLGTSFYGVSFLKINSGGIKKRWAKGG
jgi:hypothetical protein